jgi:hypothetical protein
MIAFGALIAAGFGLLSYSPVGDIPQSVVSLYGETVVLDGNGLYARDSISCAAQARGQDAVTLLIGVPLLLVGTYLMRKGSLHGKMLQAGALGYMHFFFSM